MENNIGGRFTNWVNPFFSQYQKSDDPYGTGSNAYVTIVHPNIYQKDEDYPDGKEIKLLIKENNLKKENETVLDFDLNTDTKQDNEDLFPRMPPIEHPEEEEIFEHLPPPKKSSIILKSVTLRAAHLGAGIGSFLTSGLDVVVGVFPGVVAFGNAFLSNLSWQRIPFSNRCFFQAQKFLRGSAPLLPRCYEHAMKVLSPKAEFSEKTFAESWIPQRFNNSGRRSVSWVVKSGNGFFTNAVIGKEQYDGSKTPKLFKLQESANKCINSNKIFVRQIIARVNYLGLAVLLTLTRTLDAMVGIIAVPLSFFALLLRGFDNGKCVSATLNNMAYRGLQAPAIINDLFYCTVKFIDPFAGTDELFGEKNEIFCRDYFLKDYSRSNKDYKI